jgi:hypothetical protein
MRSAGAHLFIVLTRGGDPLGEEFGLTNVGARAAGLFYLDQVGTLHRTAIAAASAANLIDESGIYKTVVGYRRDGGPMLGPDWPERYGSLSVA